MTCDFIESQHLRMYTALCCCCHIGFVAYCLYALMRGWGQVGGGGELLLFSLLPEYPVRINVQN